MKKRILAFILCLFFVLGTGMVFAGGQGDSSASSGKDNFPNRPIKLILPVSPGGGMDTTARQWQKFFEAELGVPLVFESLAGAGTLIGNRAVAQADGDGYTLGLVSSSDFLFSILTMDAPYKIEDYYWVGVYYSDPSMVWVHKDSPWNTMKEFTDWVKKQPPKTVPISIPTQTSPNFIQVKNLEKAAGVEFNIIAFSGGNPARLAVASKEVVMSTTGVFNGQMIADSCKIIGCVDNTNPSPEKSNNAKTVNEEYGSNVVFPYNFYGLYVPKALVEKYPQRAEFIAKAFERAINNPDYYAQMKAIGQEAIIDYKNPRDTRKAIEENMKVLESYTEYFK